MAVMFCSGCMDFREITKNSLIDDINNASDVIDLKLRCRFMKDYERSYGDFPEVNRLYASKLKELQNAEYEEKEAKKKSRTKYANKVYPNDSNMRYYIIKNYLKLGMTENDVFEMRGYPPHGTNRSVGSWGTHEQWVYGIDDGMYSSHGPYLYFKNGILTSWQN